jgi:predicted MFS family arabinose efflux permease
MTSNARLAGLESASNVAGRGLGGFLIQLCGAATTVLIDALTYLWSAALVWRVRSPEPLPASEARRSLLREVAEGLRFVATDPVLRPVVLEGAFFNLGLQMSMITFVLLLADSPGALGLFFALGGAGALLGSLTASRVVRRLGEGRALWLPGLLTAPFALAVAAFAHGPGFWIAALGWTITTWKVGLDNVVKVAFRQRAAPAHLLGRVNATFRFLITGALAVGSALAGLIGQYAGVRTALWVATAIISLRWLFLCSPAIRRL